MKSFHITQRFINLFATEMIDFPPHQEKNFLLIVIEMTETPFEYSTDYKFKKVFDQNFGKVF